MLLVNSTISRNTKVVRKRFESLESPSVMLKRDPSSQNDSFNRDYSLTLVNSLRSFINLKLDHERQTCEFLEEFRQRLFYVHQYNCEVSKITNKYPRSRQLDSLLIKYIELEFEVLYKSEHLTKRIEEECELRIIRILQFMLYPIFKISETVDRDVDRAVNKTALQLLGRVKSSYLVPDKLICNVANQLRDCEKDSRYHSPNLDSHRNSATSDYGSDYESDLDSEQNNFLNKVEISPDENYKKNIFEYGKSASGVPTIEFTDDDNYFVYLERQPKRKTEDYSFLSTKRIHPASNKSHLLLASYPTKKESYSNIVVKNEDSCICIDSDDEKDDKTTVQKSKKEVGVVTFEILDDDDDTTNNYMVYLQKEVATNKKVKSKTTEIVICSDSEDEAQETSGNQIVPEDCNNTSSSDEGFNSNISSVVSLQVEEAENLNGIISLISQDVKNEKAVSEENDSQAIPIDLNLPILYEVTHVEESHLHSVDPNVIFDHLPQHSGANENNEETILPGDPLLSEKESIDEAGNNSDCKINESLLEELLLDENYLLEGRKEFEELEYFLFNESADKGNFCFDNDENDVSVPETFDADLNSLQSFLANSELINSRDSSTVAPAYNGTKNTQESDNQNFENR